MALMKNTIITKKGQALMAKLIAGTATTKFTKVALSSTVYSQSQLENLTALTNIKQQEAVSRTDRKNGNAVEVQAAVTNQTLNAGYYLNTIGLYATDPQEGEILYSVTIAEEADYMPPYNGVTSTGVFFKLLTVVSNSANVSLDIDPAAVATMAEIIRLTELIELHLNSETPHKSKVNGVDYSIGFEVVNGQPRIIYKEAD